MKVVWTATAVAPHAGDERSRRQGSSGTVQHTPLEGEEELVSQDDYELDVDQLEEAALAILSLTLHDGRRVWKALDWGLMDRLHERGWISDPKSKAKSVVLSDEAKEVAARVLRERFAKR